MPTQCVCFFSAGDADGVSDCINKSFVALRSCHRITSAIMKRSLDSCSVSFLHKSDFDDCGILQRHIPGVLAALCGMGVLFDGPQLPSRYSVRPGPFDGAMADKLLSPQASSLWRVHIRPQFRACAPGGRCFARAYLHDVCKTSPFADFGVGGPAEVMDAVSELTESMALDPEHCEYTGTVYILRLLKPLDHQTTAVPLKEAMDEVSYRQRAILKDVEGFFLDKGCVNRRLCARFGLENEAADGVEGCACAACAPEDAL